MRISLHQISSFGALLGVACFAGGMLLARASAADAPKRFPFDQSSLHRLRVAHPHAAELFEQGEAHVRKADFERATQAFAAAAKEAPQNGLVHRRHCQSLVELGRRSEALAACERALKTGATPMDQRAMVGALMLGPGEPTAEEVNQSIHFAALAKERLHDQPAGFAAECDIARRLRDEGAFKTCIDNLSRSMPTHHETKRVVAMAPRPGTAARWAGWTLFGSIVLATALHAARRRLRVSRRSVAGAAVVFVALSVPARGALAQHSASPSASSAPAPGEAHWRLSRWRINQDDPESSVPTPEQRNTNALEFGYHLQDLAAEGQKAENKADYRRSVKFWRAITKAVPDSNAGYFRACNAYEKLGEREKAIEFCGRALGLPPDYHASEAARYAKLVLAKEGRLNRAEIDELDEVTRHLRTSKQPLAAFYAEQIQCELAMKVDDRQRLANCSANLVKLAPKDPRTVTYQWALALRREDFDTARKLVAQARTTAMKPEAVAELERGIEIARGERRRRYTDWALLIGGAALAIVLAIVGVRQLLARRRRAGTPTDSPAAAMDDVGSLETSGGPNRT